MQEAALARADQFVREGRAGDAIRTLTDANRREPNGAFETRLVELRHLAFDLAAQEPNGRTTSPVIASTTPRPLQALTPNSLSVSTLRAGLAEHGCVSVRGLVSAERAGALAADIDSALAAYDASTARPDEDFAPWYVPFVPSAGRYRVGGRRRWVRASGALWTADSPRMLFQLCDLIEDTGIGELVGEYLGERPALSANKCTLRRVPVDTATNWHQDGAFLGADARTLNLWLVLSECDANTPGLEIVPRRFDRVLPTGTEGAMFDWSISPAIVDDVARATPVLRPSFQPGDALLFDHLFVHRTAAGPGMTRERYAMETWFFAPSSYPDGQIPLVF
jgi:hypothetical protein